MNIEQERALLPCPFCGGEAKLIIGFPPLKSSFVDCPTCDASGHIYEKPEEAIEHWNRRAALQPRPEVEGVTLDGCLETLFRVGEYLGIDYVAARKAPMAPSDVYIKAIEDRVALQSQKPKGNDIMLSGVIRMPFEMAMADPISRMQFYQRAQQALNELEALQSQDREDAERLDWLVENMNSVDIDEGHRGWFVLERGTTRYVVEDCKTYREAIDHIRNIEGNNDATV